MAAKTCQKTGAMPKCSLRLASRIKEPSMHEGDGERSNKMRCNRGGRSCAACPRQHGCEAMSGTGLRLFGSHEPWSQRGPVSPY